MFNEKFMLRNAMLIAVLINLGLLFGCGGGGSGYGGDGSSTSTYDTDTTGGGTTGDGTVAGSNVAFTLKTLYPDFVGVGGSINGVKNPNLNVAENDVVTINIVNGQNMTHNLALEGYGVATIYISNTGNTASVTFTATTAGTSAYYCAVSGHRAAGMEGKLIVAAGAKTAPAGFAVERVLDPWVSGAPSLALLLPQGFKMDKEQGPDFDVYYFSEYAGGPGMGIYVGISPDLFSYGQNTSQKEGFIQDKKVIWLEWNDVDKDNVALIKREIIIRDMFWDSSVPELQVHIFLTCYSEEDADTLQKYAQTLVVSP